MRALPVNANYENTQYTGAHRTLIMATFQPHYGCIMGIIEIIVHVMAEASGSFLWVYYGQMVKYGSLMAALPRFGSIMAGLGVLWVY